MQADFPVLLDACVLANYGVCDLFLRLAEPPRLFLPRWSDTILAEVKRTHLTHLTPRWPEELAEYFQSQVRQAFPDAAIANFEHIIPALTNDPKDRHVLAAAIQGNVSLIVTFNLRDFSKEALAPWKVEAVHPQDYLLTLYSMNPAAVVGKLAAIAGDRKHEIQDVLIHLGKAVPRFASQVLTDMGK